MGKVYVVKVRGFLGKVYTLKAEGLWQVCILKVGGLGQGVYTEGRGFGARYIY